MKTMYYIRIAGSVEIAVADVMQAPEKSACFLITRVQVPVKFRGKGYGRLLLKTVLLDADRKNCQLVLVPSPSGRAGIDPDHDDLARWYERYGFVKKHVFEFSDKYHLWFREPGVVTEYRGFEIWHRSPGCFELYREGFYQTSSSSAWGLHCYVDEVLQP